MRKEAENWLSQAKSDREKAVVLEKAGHFDGAVFFFQQAAEKALKAYLIVDQGELLRGHSLLELARLAKVPKTMMTGIRDLAPEYLITRYPDMTAGIPADNYDKSITKRHNVTAHEVMAWVESQIE